MQVKVTEGYGKHKPDAQGQQRFLDWFRELIEISGLAVESITSETPTGGPITLTVSDNAMRQVTTSFLTLAAELSELYGCQVNFDLVIVELGTKITIEGECAAS